MSVRQAAMVMDLNKCLGCQTCTVACKRLWTRREGIKGMWWNTVNTMPGAGTPKNWEHMGGGFRDGKAQPSRQPSQAEFGEAWDFNYNEVFFEGKPGTALKPGNKDPQWGPNWDEDAGAGEYPNNYYFYLPRICNHCTHPACKAACPRNAIEKRDQDGIVLINEDKCRGYRFCMEACPYKKIYFNSESSVSQKCIFCLPRLEEGVVNACARQCPGRVRFVGYLDDPKGPIHRLVNEFKVALPLHAEYGTEPNVFYVPPYSPPRLDESGTPTEVPRIPLGYLESLFGKGVQAAMNTLEVERNKRQNGQPSELMDILISRNWLDRFGPFTKSPREAKALADKKRGQRK